MTKKNTLLRKSGRENQLTGQIGEYLVAAELGRRGYISTTFTQNVPEFDILAIDKTLKRKIPIQVKTIHKGGGWQSTATKWMDIKFVGKRQVINMKLKIANPNLIFVFVELGKEYGEDCFYVMLKKQVQNIMFEVYSKWLAQKGGIRPNKPESLHCGIKAVSLNKYKNNWRLLNKI
jgi:hypothetical protein